MAERHLAVYLNDHLAGAVAAIEMLDTLVAIAPAAPLGRAAAGLRDEIAADCESLEALMTVTGVARSAPRRISAWLIEKMTELKLRVDDPTDTGLRVFEILEAVALGIDGKRALWAALEAAAADNPALKTTDYPRLAARADDQRSVIEALRITAAKQALAGGAERAG
jgi:hypothetical protein